MPPSQVVDCNTCRHHEQGSSLPIRCRTCLTESMHVLPDSVNYLPLWEPLPMPKTNTVTAAEYRANVMDPMCGIGGGPTRATTLPTEAAERKKFPVASGVLDYFPDAIAAVSFLSYKGNEQHNPGKSLHWDRTKSLDHADTMLRHFLQRGTLDTDGVRHSVKMVWRALALLQTELEKEPK